jgi:NADH-quinone oxidoreductase subunit N
MLIIVSSGGYFSFKWLFFYVLVYFPVTFGIWSVVMSMPNVYYINDFLGFSKSNKAFALCILILLFSMGGVPPFFGFFAKLGVFQSLISSGSFFGIFVVLLSSMVGIF